MATTCRVLTIIGGASIDAQTETLDSGVDVVVATPGRLLDLLERGALHSPGSRVPCTG